MNTREMGAPKPICPSLVHDPIHSSNAQHLSSGDKCKGTWRLTGSAILAISTSPRDNPLIPISMRRVPGTCTYELYVQVTLQLQLLHNHVECCYAVLSKGRIVRAAGCSWHQRRVSQLAISWRDNCGKLYRMLLKYRRLRERSDRQSASGTVWSRQVSHVTM